jgi:uncharacterized protein (TIGR02284 family)
MDYNKSVEALNTLIEINLARAKAYKIAYTKTDDNELQALFTRLQYDSEKCTADLGSELLLLGGTPIETTSISGRFHPAWMDIRAALIGQNQNAILQQCEYGEDIVVTTYKNVLQEQAQNLGRSQFMLVKTQSQLIRESHEEIKALRNIIAYETY